MRQSSLLDSFIKKANNPQSTKKEQPSSQVSSLNNSSIK